MSNSEPQSQQSASDPPEFDPTQPSVPISYPIKTLHELESRSYFDSFHYPFNKASVPIQSGGSPSLPNRRRMLVCHDMAGGYTDDKWIQGGTNADAYAIWHWHLIDVFVYFSHNLVTLPPPGWTNTGHRHGVKVLGTFITEWDEGRAVCNTMLSTKESSQMYAERLAELAAALGFDGWLLNMEVDLDPGQISNLKEFVNHLTLTMHSSVPGSLVIWYDSVTTNGELQWQNKLDEYNKPFFDICDGIFVNYTWEEDYPKLSAHVAGDRKFDVYMGIDVFGRNTYGGGQWNTNVALDVIRKDDVSAAIFAPGWVYETKQAPDFQTAQNRWWGLVEKSWGIVRNFPGALPFYTNFDQGRGYHISADGDKVSDATWCNLSSQGLQPNFELTDPTPNSSIQVSVDPKEASYSGGGNITFKGSLEGQTYFEKKIFQGEFPVGELPIQWIYSVKSDSNSSLGLALEFTSSTKERTSVLLTSQEKNIFSSKFSKVLITRELKGLSSEWVVYEGSIAMNGYILKEIHAVCYRSDLPFNEPRLKSRSYGPDSAVASSTDYFAVLGQMTIKTSAYKPDFPESTSWLVDGKYIKWTSDPQGSKTLSLKLAWNLKDGKNHVFPNYKVYVKKVLKQADSVPPVPEYIGVAQVNCFYVSDLKIPSDTSSIKFIIQVSSIDGTNQKLDESPYYELDVENP
ncbi:cytosolic endo-beta-N-acetylglucosaminidase 1 [Senna tora]|uniref:mannosyl-glycoprotein endo-beta-N-acetylglucosaminidase n=1 Tax=Senna tora TaxID=362788 RepID=A0A834WGT6_9FABA|nr:cytosolic endo-beta-N-acetylglucosaminidase 1 [Senna tora]